MKREKEKIASDLERKTKVGMVQINNSFTNQNYFPYSIGTLQAYAQKHLANIDDFEFLLPIYKRITVEEAVEKLRGYGYSDLAIFQAIYELSDYQFLVPSGYGILASCVDPKDVNFKFPVVGFYRPQFDKESRREVLGVLTGKRNEYVQFYKMRNGKIKLVTVKTSNW